ncbi:helix-turn-helix domain-containing protein [Streptomyces sp. NPDC094153]|uniref:helix-turn-helix domain-containing protein n=1 Tax=Streptomyces sp. NPDC094153 TaxID=3366058 RepID=UPI00382FBDCD
MSHGRNPALTGDERRIVATEFAQMYQAGASIRAIARQTGRSYGAVHKLLADAGVQFRPRGARRPY